MVLPLTAFGQERGTLKTFIYDILTHKCDISQQSIRDSLNRFDFKEIRRSFDYLSKYDTDSVIFNNYDDLSDILSLYIFHDDKIIRIKAFNLYLDIYRLSCHSTSPLQIYPSDVDKKIRTKILNIMSDKPYSEKELKVLTTRKKLYFNKVYSDDYLLEYRRIDTTIMSLAYVKDSLVNEKLRTLEEKLKTPTCEIETLSELCAWLYIYEAIPYIEKYLKVYDNHRLKVHLASLGVKNYEDELIKDNFNKMFLNFDELAYLNSPKSKVAMIQGLRIEGRHRGFISGYKQGKFVSEEIDGAFYKLSNLDILLLGHYFTIEIPYEGNRYINNEDISLFPKCEEVAKWMEDNIDKLEVNPNLRF